MFTFKKFCRPKFSAWLAEKTTVGHEQSANSIEQDGWIFALNQEHEELCELIMFDSASVHVCPPNHGQENGLRISSKTIPLLTASGAEMKQHGTRQVSCDREVGKITTDYRVLDARRPIWSLGSMMMRCALREESLLDIQRRRERTRHDPQRRSVLRGSQTFKIVVEGSKHAGTQSYDSSRGRGSGTGKGTRCVRSPGSATLDGDGEPTVRIKVPTGPATPSAEERALHDASGHVPHRSWCQWCIAARGADKPHLRGSNQIHMKPCQELSLTSRISDESRIKCCQFLPSMQSMLVLKACQQHFSHESIQ